MSLEPVPLPREPQNSTSLQIPARDRFSGGIFIVRGTSIDKSGTKVLDLVSEGPGSRKIQVQSEKNYPPGTRLEINKHRQITSSSLTKGISQESKLVLPSPLPQFLEFPKVEQLLTRVLGELFLPMKAEPILAILGSWNRKGYLPFFLSASSEQKQHIFSFAGVVSQLGSAQILGDKEIPGLEKILLLLGSQSNIPVPQGDVLGEEEATFYLLNFLSAKNPHKGRWFFYSLVQEQQRRGLVRLYYLPNLKAPARIEGELYKEDGMHYSYFWIEPNRGRLSLSSRGNLGGQIDGEIKEQLLALLSPYRFDQLSELNFPAFDPPGILEEIYG